MPVNLAQYPSLRTLVMDSSVAEISDQDAYYLYQQNWPNIDTSKLCSDEIELVQRLIDTVGGGVFAVTK